MVGADMDTWISPSRRPPGLILSDPSGLRRAALVAWIEYFRDSQTGRLLPDQRIQMRQVFAGLSPIDVSLSQESSRRLEYIPQQLRETWVLEFTNTVTKCHAPNSMEYPATSLAYLKFLKRSEAAAAIPLATVPVLPDGFFGLPIGNPDPSAAIDGQEQALILKMADSLPVADYGTLVPELIDAINTFEAHSPASVSRLNYPLSILLTIIAADSVRNLGRHVCRLDACIAPVVP